MEDLAKKYADRVYRAVEKLPKAVVKAIQNYTEDSKSLNKSLILGRSLDREQSEVIEKLDLAFQLMPPLPEPIHVWRGGRYNLDTMMESMGSFISTSYQKSRALEFVYTKTSEDTRLLLSITVPAGCKILPLETHSTHDYEREILLPRNGSFHVIAVSIEKFPKSDDTYKRFEVTFIPQVLEGFEAGESVRESSVGAGILEDKINKLETSEQVDEIVREYYDRILDSDETISTVETVRQLLLEKKYPESLLKPILEKILRSL